MKSVKKSQKKLIKKRKECNCQKELGEAQKQNNKLSDGYAQDGDTWTCPKCKTEWTHLCSESEGCCWFPF